MSKHPQLTLDGAPIKAPTADPALVCWLRDLGVAGTDSERLAEIAAKRMQFMPMDIKVAYQVQLTALRQLPEARVVCLARQQLREKAIKWSRKKT